MEVLAAWPGRLWVLAAALLIDALIGDPDWLWRRVSHPVALLGRLIGAAERALNRPSDPPARRRLAGIAALVGLVAVSAGAGWALSAAAGGVPYGWLIEAVVAAVFLAQRSLYDHVAAVAKALETGGIGAARAAVSRIVGRDPASLDEAGVARAAIESAAENYSDGVVAPAFWFALFGLPGMLAYKAVNTADSMIGHLTERHAAFGWAAARLDDLVNLVPARLTGLLIAAAAPLAGGSPGGAVRAMVRDAAKHRSPNAGWPEAAMAGALGLALAGPRRYGGRVVEDAWMGAGGRSAATAMDIRRALRVLLTAGAVLLLAIVVAAAAS